MRKIKQDKKRGLPSRSPSLESTASVASVATPRVGRRSSLDKIPQDNISAYGRYLFDCCALLIYCPKHKNFGLTKISTIKGTFLPFVALKNSEGWYATGIGRLKQLLSVGPGSKNYLSFSPPELVHFFRIQVPNILKFASRITYFSQLTHQDKYPQSCCQPGGKLQWIHLNDVLQANIPDLWGPEPLVFAHAFTGKSEDKGTYTEFTMRETLKFTPRDPAKSPQEELLCSAKMTERDVIKVYSEFLQHTYPSQYMMLHSFSEYMTKLGWGSEDMDLFSTFRAFGYNYRGYLSFHEFLLGLAAVSKQTPHGGQTGNMRCAYIFRYYDTNQDEFLDHQEMYTLVSDILKAKGTPHNQQSIVKEIEANCQIIKVGVNDPITKEQFARGVSTMAFRGSSLLFRCTFNIVGQIYLKKCYDSVSMLQSNVTVDFGGGSGGKPVGTCARCKTKKYTLAMHTVRLALDGTIIGPEEVNQEDALKMMKEKRTQSKQEFSKDNIANKMLDWIRDYAIFANVDERVRSKQIKAKTGLNFWCQSDRGPLTNAITKMLNEAEAIFRRESRCIKINSPCYILGDIHGNLHDLLVYERILWSKGPVCNESSFLFLGDYVDRGDFGLEVVLYLMSYKVLNPEKFFMLRGNHELRQIQTVFTFKKECSEKFGQQAGMIIWESCNKIFDIMPLCAVIDESVFCAHGGIPTSITKIDEMNTIPSPLPDPENQSPSAWEILWNDPVSGNEFGEYLEMLKLQGGSNAFAGLQGFLPNTKRGTAFFYSEEAVGKFLTSNGLTHIVRAHEVIPPGYQFHMGGKVITVFSSSRYCNGINEAACVWVEQEKVRIIRLETYRT